MNEWFVLNDLPHPEKLGFWDDKQKLLDEIDSGALANRITHGGSPVFLKACHITQGAANSVMRIKDLEALQDREKITAFVGKMWGLKADDAIRPCF